MYSFSCNGQHLVLHPDRAIFWEEKKTLILSDLHFGKTGHFRKSGIAIPQNVYKEDLQRLVSLIQFFNPRELIIVGDLFHSQENKELDLFKKWRSDLSSVSFQLVKGNHDILPDEWYNNAGISINRGYFQHAPFSFVHDPGEEAEENNSFLFTGHIHPGVSIKGMGKQSLHFPCFYFTSTHCILPAFSRFTGTASIRAKKGDAIFAIVENSILKVA
jgi:DNA ligase-associated metallophosphoesterase